MSESPFRLDGEIALITGGGTGLGLAMARSLVAAGARVVITGRRQDVLAKAAAEVGAEAIAHDVMELARAGELVEMVIKKVGMAPTLLVNNAGILLKKPALETTPEEFQAVLQTHVLGAFALTRAAAPAMLARQQGSILFIASMATLIGIPQLVAYSAAKAAYGGMVRALATEFSPAGVRVNAIAPGWIESDMSRGALEQDPARRDRILQRTPMGRLGQAEDIGHAAVYLCSPAAKFVTGVVLPVDGGMSAGF